MAYPSHTTLRVKPKALLSSNVCPRAASFQSFVTPSSPCKQRARALVWARHKSGVLTPKAQLAKRGHTLAKRLASANQLSVIKSIGVLLQSASQNVRAYEGGLCLLLLKLQHFSQTRSDSPQVPSLAT